MLAVNIRGVIINWRTRRYNIKNRSSAIAQDVVQCESFVTTMLKFGGSAQYIDILLLANYQIAC